MVAVVIDACRIYYRNSSTRITFLLEANNVSQVVALTYVDFNYDVTDITELS